MADTKPKIVRRSQRVAFMDTDKTGSTPRYERMTGFTTMTNSKEPKEYSRQYVDEDAERSDVVGYAPSIVFSYKCDELDDPLISEYHAISCGFSTREEIDTIKEMAFKVNNVLKEYFASIGVELIDFKLEFGKTSDGKIVLADEISPDTCRFWDIKTHEKLDKDRFRRDLGGVEDAYAEMMKRTGLD